MHEPSSEQKRRELDRLRALARATAITQTKSRPQWRVPTVVIVALGVVLLLATSNTGRALFRWVFE